MPATLFIDGAAGTTGLEVAERLAPRPEFRLVTLDAERRKDPAARREALNDADFAILCLPDEAAREAVAMVDPGSRVRIIDASSAHRTAAGWTYGLPEITGRRAVAEARRVSNPGCYPTGFLTLLAPLTRCDRHPPLLPADWPYTVNAVSGYSGGGKPLIARFADESRLAFRAYGLTMGHKHLAEMQAHAHLVHAPVFSPSVVRAYRGMVLDIPLPLGAMRTHATARDLHARWLDVYADCPAVRVAAWGADPGELLLEDGAPSWDGIDLHLFEAPGGGQLRLVAKLDNLGKGASGAVVQSLNLMAGLPETAGLRLDGEFTGGE
ncbi:N-acetyl-gamma-glutamyl-phosphate reductase [Erythrobacteraceae bacterium CFH 75059]|uniref:N-acetyl-gamma-glutamyl-phosphate reductase n=1 Tax=Qipengyuania thermophila TaxID=2509361 RepID=UPI0010226DF5|nr:N-acetyl-gamma-glutamyl-phosphate reductase [Qipengyuania thermophila]TCD06197.1 N-acetyl-gamma-glutamyl-phosphate reductase [Erythrobacteraceae bacterium CFH 75059]